MACYLQRPGWLWAQGATPHIQNGRARRTRHPCMIRPGRALGSPPVRPARRPVSSADHRGAAHRRGSGHSLRLNLSSFVTVEIGKMQICILIEPPPSFRLGQRGVRVSSAGLAAPRTTTSLPIAKSDMLPPAVLDRSPSSRVASAALIFARQHARRRAPHTVCCAITIPAVGGVSSRAASARR
jgi:hypothetical protein